MTPGIRAPISHRLKTTFGRSAAIVALSFAIWRGVPLLLGYQAVHPLTGRKIASVMSSAGADWLERSEREAEENVEGALDAIGIQKGSTVAEVGAGTGYVSMKLAQRVGPGGKVYANDIQPEMLVRLRQNASKAGVSNVETALGTATDPRLPAGRIDLIILVGCP